EDCFEMKALRCLCPPQRRTVDCFSDKSIFDALDRIAERQARDYCWGAAEPANNSFDQRGIGKRTGSVVDQNSLGAMHRQGLQPQPNRILTSRAACYGC